MDERVAHALAPAPIRTGSWSRYTAAVALTVLALLGVYSALLAALSLLHILPPPAIVNELCADEKLRWIRQHHSGQPNLLIAGSSIAWRDIDALRLVQRNPRTRPLNGGMCLAQVNQTDFVARYLVRHLPSVHTVVTVLGPDDFADCTHARSRLFNPATADAYVFGDDWPYRFYLSQFDPLALIRNARQIRAWHAGETPFDSLEITRYGDGPLRTEGSRGGLLYAPTGQRDPACVASLHHLAAWLDAGGRQLFVAMAPVSPEWTARDDRDGHRHAALAADIGKALHGTSAAFWDGTAAFDGKPGDFTDAVHINWPAAKRYSSLLAQALFPAKPPAQR